MTHPPLRRSNGKPAGIRARHIAFALACVALWMLAVPTPALATKTLSLSTGSIQISLPAGGSGSGSVVVANTGTEIIDALVYVADARVDAKGMPVYDQPSAGARPTPRSAATWIGLQMPPGSADLAGRPTLRLKAGEQATVSFAETVPPNARPGDHNAVIFFEMYQPDPADPKGAVSKVTGRIGARVVTQVQGEIRDSLKVVGFTVPGLVIGDKAPYSFTVVNDGNVDKRYTARVAAPPAPESVAASAGVAYAGDKSSYAGIVSLGGAGIGPTTVVLTVGHTVVSRDSTASAEVDEITRTAQVVVVPLWVVLTAGGFVAVAVLWLAWYLTMRRRRRRVASAVGTSRAVLPTEGRPPAVPPSVPPSADHRRGPGRD